MAAYGPTLPGSTGSGAIAPSSPCRRELGASVGLAALLVPILLEAVGMMLAASLAALPLVLLAPGLAARPGTLGVGAMAVAGARAVGEALVPMRAQSAPR